MSSVRTWLAKSVKGQHWHRFGAELEQRRLGTSLRWKGHGFRRTCLAESRCMLFLVLVPSVPGGKLDGNALAIFTFSILTRTPTQPLQDSNLPQSSSRLAL